MAEAPVRALDADKVEAIFDSWVKDLVAHHGDRAVADALTSPAILSMFIGDICQGALIEGPKQAVAPLWDQVWRRLLAEGVNFDRPERGMAVLRDVLGEATATTGEGQVCGEPAPNGGGEVCGKHPHPVAEQHESEHYQWPVRPWVSAAAKAES